MNDTLEHHGILGMKWGVRRYQNKDGTWTKKGKEHRAEEETQKHGTSDTIEVKANSVFTKNELDAVKNNEVDDPELLELMLMEVIDATGYSDGEFEFDTSWEDEMEKFKKDPHNYTFRFKGYDYETHHSDDSSEEDSLMHYGILGMKWGIRRYQNSDGSLTAAGRKRYGDDTPDGNSSSSGNSSDSTPRTPAKSASEMSDQELQSALNRLRMEQQYNELTGAKSSNQYQNQQNFSTPPSNTGNLSNAELQAYITRLDMEKRYAQLTAPPPKQLTNGQKFLKEVIPAVAMEVGRELVKNTMKKMLGLSGDNNENKNNNNNDNNKKKDKSENNNDALNKLRGRLDESDKRMNLIKNSIESLDKNIKTLSNKSNEDRKQTESIQKDFLDFMKKNAQQIQQEEKKNNDALRAEWKSNAGSQKSNWSYSSGSDDYSYYENPWTYHVNRA